MHIATFIDGNTPFVYSTLGWGVQGMSKYLHNCTIDTWSYDDLKQKTPITGYDNNDNVDFVIFEIGNPQHAGWTTQELKNTFPNAKLIALCSDTCYYLANNLGPQMDPTGIDLHLELMPNCFQWLKDNGAPLVDRWFWTISDRLLSMANTYYIKCSPVLYKIYDFIGVYHPGSLSNPDCWRYKAVKRLEQVGKTFTNGGGNGHEDNNWNRLFEHYCRSKFTLGTTSHNRPELTTMGCVKGFRDSLGPILGSLLIYDEHPNISSMYHNTVPFYNYNDFDSIVELIKHIMSCDYLYNNLLLKQINWNIYNTIDKQLVRISLKYDWITQKDIVDGTV